MKKRISIPTMLVLILLSCLTTFQITYVSLTGKSGNTDSTDGDTTSAFAKLNYVDSLYRSNYVGDIDEEQLSDYLIRGYIVGAGDKYASYMTAEEFTEYMQDSSGEMVGIGVHVLYNSELGGIEVISVMRDSPALKDGVQVGDLIVAVEGESVSSLGYQPAVNKMLGEKGTVANFTVLRGENYTETVEFSIIRDTVTETTVEAHMMDLPESSKKIGYVRIENFASNTGDSVKTAVDDLIAQGAEGLIFDVRYNPGGALTAIVETLDYLLPEGPIIHIIDKDGNEDAQYTSDAACIDLPMAVLVNGSTASAAELFTSALQDYKKATIIGTTTYGKGTMQTVVSLPDGSGLTISYRMYNPPYSDNYEGVGITPDIVLDLTEEAKNINFYRLTLETDNQLQAAVAVLTNP